ncbi:tripartite motif-containing protein 16 [Fundulus heteroclitus]|uniref:tripartite motif-containing protein 16 n=1 Tax=Fundulus heteroclitus TaxID=8078 RepID=UPI00165A9EE3|nr:tripartite motif-containing protein 16 [Fundulus heteroclitus]
MAQGIQLERERFCCSLCSELLNNPVAIPCGHSFCLTCINRGLDNEESSGIYSCPQCREIFLSRPTLVKNGMIAFVVDQLRKSLKHAVPDPEPGDVTCDFCLEKKVKAIKSCLQCMASYCATHLQPHKDVAPLRKHKLVDTTADKDCDPEPGDVACDFCTEKKVKAIQSCLQCMASYCATHLQPHKDVAPLRKHKLVEPTADLEESICPEHQELMKMFCQTDQKCICYVCAKDGHKGHNKVTTAAERAERQKSLQAARQRIQLRIQEKKKHVQTFKQEEDAVSHAADAALTATDKLFTELIKTMEKKLSHVKEKMTSRQDAELGRFRKARNKVEEDVMELNRKDVEMDKLYRTEDHTYFLLKYPKLCRLSEPKESPNYKIRRQRNFERVIGTVSEAKKNLHKLLEEECEKILLALTGATGSLAEPQPQLEEGIMNPRPEVIGRQTSTEQTTAQFVQSRLSQILVSPMLPRPSFSTPGLQDPRSQSRHVRQQSENLYISGDENTTPTSVKQSPDFFSKQEWENPDVIQVETPPVENNPRILLRRSKKDRREVLKARAHFLQYASQITLNPDTTNTNLILAKENKKVIFVSEAQDYPNHPERFAYTWQVLSDQSFDGRCYLEVERSGRGVLVAMTYKDIGRAETFNNCMFGQNNKSWALDCFKNSYEFRHNNNKTPIPGIWSSRVGVYLDHKAGLLAFYSISNTMTLLHKVQTTFTEPLYFGLWLSDGATAEISTIV